MPKSAQCETLGAPVTLRRLRASVVTFGNLKKTFLNFFEQIFSGAESKFRASPDFWNTTIFRYTFCPILTLWFDQKCKKCLSLFFEK